jgi:hypothetical protein
MPDRGRRSGSDDEHDPASASIDAVDQMIELIAQVRMLDQHAQPMGTIDSQDLHLMLLYSTKHDPLFAQSRPLPHRAWRQQFDPFDRLDDMWPVENIRDHSEGLCRLRCDRL